MLYILTENEYKALTEDKDLLIKQLRTGKDDVDKALRGILEDIQIINKKAEVLYNTHLPFFGRGRKVRDIAP